MGVVPHWRISALGRLLGNSGERFSYSVNMTESTIVEGGPFGGATLDPNQAVFTDIANDVKAFHGRAASLISDAAVLEEVKIAAIGSDGKYTSDPVIVNVTDTPGGAGGVSGQSYITPQAALAVSLVTGRRGPTGKGRFYIPMPVVSIDQNTGLALLTSIEGLRGSAATFLSALNNQPGLDLLGLRVVVVSSKGYKSDVNGVRVGRVVDTIRSRRAQLKENYTTSVPVT